MPDLQPFAGLNQDDVQEAILETLREIAARLPMPDAATGLARFPVLTANPASGALTSVGTVTTLTNLTNVVSAGALPLNTMVYDLMRQASSTLYDNLVVT